MGGAGPAHIRGRIGKKLLRSFVFFALAIFSKSTVVTVPAVAFLLVLVRENVELRRNQQGRSKKILRAFVLTAPLLFLALVSVALQVFASKIFPDAPKGMKLYYSIPETAVFATKILGTLFRIALLPFKLRLIYDVAAPGIIGPVAIVLGIFSMLATLLGLWLLLKKKSAVGFGLVIPAVLLVPFLQIIPFMTWSLASERFLFLPVFGFALAAAALIFRLPLRARVATAVILFAILGTGTVIRNWDWQSEKLLLEQTALRAPAHPIAVRIYLHYVLIPKFAFDEARIAARGVPDENERRALLIYVDAMQAFREKNMDRLRSLVPFVVQAMPSDDYNMRKESANLALEAGMPDIAEKTYRELLAQFPNIGEVHYNLGLALHRENRHREAAEEIQAAIDQGFAPAKAWNNLGISCRDAGQPERAAKAFRQALVAEPAYWHAAYNLARLQLAQNNPAGARESLKIARERAVSAGDSAAPLDALEKQMNPQPAPP